MIRQIFSIAPKSSYLYMSGVGDPPPEPAPAPAPVPDKSTKELEDRIEGLENRLETVMEESKSWTTKEIKAALSRLENLEATTKEGLKNLSEQVTEAKTHLQGLLTRKSQEPPPDKTDPQAPPLSKETPPIQPPPPSPPAEGEGQKDQPTNLKTKAGKRVV